MLEEQTFRPHPFIFRRLSYLRCSSRREAVLV